MTTNTFPSRAEIKPQANHDWLLPFKVKAHQALTTAQRAVAGAVRAVPGAASWCGVPQQRVRSLQHWVDAQRARRDWWTRREAAYYEAISPAYFERGFKAPHCAIGAQAHLSAGVGQYHVHNEVFLAGLPGGRVLGPNGVVMTPDGSGIIEESTWGMGWLEKDRAMTSWRLPKPEFCAGHYFTVACHMGDAYAHWITDVLPRLALLERLPIENIQIILPGRALDSWQQESLELLGLEHLSFVPLGRRHLQLEFLHFPSYVGLPGYAHPMACQWLRAKLLKGFESSRPTRHLYVTRRRAGRRHVINEAELEPILARYGFEIIEAENMSFREKLQLFSQAAAVVGPHGAGLSHLVFAPPECRVLELFAPTCFRWIFYYLASVMGQPYWYLSGQYAVPSNPLHQDHGFDDLYVAPDEFAQSLEALLGR